ncbi:MAG: APC family permease [Actinomycetota bacterium]|nr:APC family permease [Actinomycetota bacterium]
MATVAAEVPSHGEFRRNLGWTDGLAMGLSIPVGGFALIGYSIGILGAWTAMLLWGVTCLVAIAQNFIFAELAAMFPDKPGGIALYAHEGWRRYFSPVGALAAVGYWAGWSFGLAVYGLIIGQLLAAQFFPHSTWSFFDGTQHIGLAVILGALAVVAVWTLNVFGVHPAVRSNKIIGVVVCVTVGILIVGPFLTGHWHHQLTWGLGLPHQAWGGWKLAIVYMYVMCWTSYGTEIAATFSPEYRDQKRDSTRALVSGGVLTLAFLVLGPLSATADIGTKAIATNPVGFFPSVFSSIIGPAAGLVTIILCGALFLNMTAATADAGRALYGISRDGMIVKQLFKLNRHGMPGRAMTIDLVVNVCLVVFVANTLGVLFASNLGYMIAVVFALSGFLLLRKDRLQWPRPIRRGPGWIAAAWLLIAFNLVLIIVGALNPGIAGYGGTTDQLIGLAILLASIVMFLFRRLVQDRARLQLREPTPTTPGDIAAPAYTGPLHGVSLQEP